MAGRPTYFRMYDHGRYMGEYRNSELMELLDIRHHQLIGYYSDTGREYKARYLIERIEEPLRDSWKAEWEYIRLRVLWDGIRLKIDRKSTRLNSSHTQKSRMPSSA